MICDYGCGETANFTLKNGRSCCAKRPGGCPEQKRANSAGLKKAYAEGRKGYTYNPNSAWSTGLTARTDKRIQRNKNIDDLFAENSPYGLSYVRGTIIKEDLLKYVCAWCGLTDTYNGKSLSLQLDHINGVSNDNRLTNLRFLCPNCHSQTDTFQGKNINKSKAYVSEDEIVQACKTAKNIRQVLLAVKLTAKGANYKRVYEVMAKHNLKFG